MNPCATKGCKGPGGVTSIQACPSRYRDGHFCLCILSD